METYYSQFLRPDRSFFNEFGFGSWRFFSRIEELKWWCSEFSILSAMLVADSNGHERRLNFFAKLSLLTSTLTEHTVVIFAAHLAAQ